jgi:hypothetical protein
MSNNTGGPAFPSVIPLVHSEQQGKDYPDYSEAGMTLRDYFAAKAMQSILDQKDTHDGRECDSAAWMAYRMAEAMLKARDQ